MIRRIFKIILGILLILYALFVVLYAFLSFGSPKPAEHITWGTTFAHSQAKDLGLDWKKAYTTLLDDAGVRRVRIPIYWDELESKKDAPDFSAWDWQLDELQKRGGTAIVVVGFKLPRWPECRIPAWLAHGDDISHDLNFSKELFQMLREVVMHYRNHPAVWAWQVENEPLLTFGVCPKADSGLLDNEIELVRKLDPSHPVIVTDTGEFSVWYEAGKRGDIVGNTLYRIIHNPKIGYVEYSLLKPAFYARKAWLFHLWQPQKRVIITELQAEPWVEKPPISNWSLQEQYKTMSPERFRANIDFARHTGFDEIYLWGGEWLVWLKEHGETEIWNEAKELFR